MLFLDELPEFDQRSPKVLRQPLEDRIVTISRAAGTLTFPASFMLVAATNPCTCGYYQDPTKECTCSPSMVTKYQKRISGPLLDPLRVDTLRAQVPRVPASREKLTGERLGEPSSVIAARVEVARERQRKRFASHTLRVVCNVDTRSGPPMCMCANSRANACSWRCESRLWKASSGTQFDPLIIGLPVYFGPPQPGARHWDAATVPIKGMVGTNAAKVQRQAVI